MAEFVRIQYPATRRNSTVNDYHGKSIPDPYSWLEDPDSEETKAFVEAQNSITMPYLEQCSVHDKFKSRSGANL